MPLRLPGRFLRLLLVTASALALTPPENARAQTFELLHGFHENPANPNPLLRESDGTLYGTTEAGGTFSRGVLFRRAPDGTWTVLHEFSGADGQNPSGRLIRASDGALYGTTQYGGSSGCGTIFKWTGASLTTAHSFTCSAGQYPRSGVIEGVDGGFYGTTLYGGTYGNGTVFKWDGSALTILHAFNYSDGYYPWGGVVQAADGSLYGTTVSGGAAGYGTLFRWNGSLTTLHSFNYYSTTGAYPYGGVTQASDGSFYGTTYYGGTYGVGTLFKWDGTALTTLHSFDYSVGAYPFAGVVEGADGAIYGASQYYGGSYYGSIFKWGGNSLTTLHVFSYSDGAYPRDLTAASDGALYGGVSAGGAGNRGLLFRVELDGSPFDVLHTFAEDAPRGPHGSLVRAADGTLYGTTEYGGVHGTGTLYKRAPDGTVTVLHHFEYTTGAYPTGRLTRGSDGALYGTTYYGGSNYYGTIFKWDGTGLTTLASFDYYSTGGYPRGGVTQGSDGALYGTTESGGPNQYGTLFKWDGSSLTTLHGFGYYVDGAYPQATVVQGSDGAYYGTTYYGGPNSYGTLFKWDGTALTTLHAFSYADGGYLKGALLQASDGALYGTTEGGGSSGAGTLFRWDGTSLATLHAFDYYAGGGNPQTGVVEGPDHALYGTTGYGGTFGHGSAFKWDGASLTTIHNFAYNVDGYYPSADLILGGDGALYGAAPWGGPGFQGTLFRIVLPPTAAATSLSTSGSGTYGGTAVLTATLISEGTPVEGRGVSFTLNSVPVGSATTDSNGVATLTGVALGGTGAGSHPGDVEATFAEDAEYLGSSAAGSLVVARAPLVVTADNTSMTLNAALPTFTASYSGFVNGDGPGHLDVPVSLATATTGGSVGSFGIVASGAADPNYLITFVDGTLTVLFATTSCLGSAGHAVLQPVNVDGTSVFKQKSTVPVKFRVCDANGVSVGAPDVVTSFQLAGSSVGTTYTSANEDPVSTTPDAAFRWDQTDGLWIFNLNTKNLQGGKTYYYQIRLTDLSTIPFQFGLR